MPITVEQKWQGAQVDNETITSEYVVSGTTDEFAAQAALDAYAAVLVGALVKQNARITGRISEDKWDGEVSWGKIEPPQTGESVLSFDTSGGQAHITQSLGTVAYAPFGQIPPDFHGAIGVTENSVEGVDIPYGGFNFSYTHYFDPALITNAYLLTLAALSYHVNNAPFKGFAAGEVLYLYATGSQRGQDQWEISYKFSASPNAVGLSIGNITGIAKGGHQYLWARYQDVEDTTAKRLVKRPIAAYVEQVYQYGNLALLGIGV